MVTVSVRSNCRGWSWTTVVKISTEARQGTISTDKGVSPWWSLHLSPPCGQHHGQAGRPVVSVWPWHSPSPSPHATALGWAHCPSLSTTTDSSVNNHRHLCQQPQTSLSTTTDSSINNHRHLCQQPQTALSTTTDISINNHRHLCQQPHIRLCQ